MRDPSPDGDERIRDFLARHGGAGCKTNREGESDGGMSGWTEVYAQDGYILRCVWSALGGLERMTYSEIAPGAGH